MALTFVPNNGAKKKGIYVDSNKSVGGRWDKNECQKELEGYRVIIKTMTIFLISVYKSFLS
jgi:hypothetical protein